VEEYHKILTLLMSGRKMLRLVADGMKASLVPFECGAAVVNFAADLSPLY